MKTAIVVFPGTNRERDMAQALQAATGHEPRLVWHKEADLGDPDLVVLPGGFSYGDYLRCGAMAAHSPAMKDVVRLAGRGVRVLGVCNGFQILVESGLLPGALLRNRSLKFICRPVCLRAETNDNGFMKKFKKGDVLQVPVAHGEGNFFASDSTLKELQDKDLIAFRYCDESGKVTIEANPNGSLDNIAGILNAQKNVLGMMPHPEDATQDWQANRSGAPLFAALATSF